MDFAAALEESLDLELLLADAGCFIPVDLSQVDAVVFQADSGYALSLAPSSAPVEFTQSLDLSYLGPDRECLDVADIADDGEEHGKRLSESAKMQRAGQCSGDR
jgi:hypothetical protein